MFLKLFDNVTGVRFFAYLCDRSRIPKQNSFNHKSLKAVNTFSSARLSMNLLLL